MAEEWDGKERRGKVRSKWAIAVPRQITVGEIIAVLTFLGGLIGAFKTLEAQQEAQAEALAEIRCELRYIRARQDGLPPPQCPAPRK